MDEKHTFLVPVLRATLLALIGVLVFRALAVEPFLVPTGSMAPALRGYHKSVACPRCGFPIVVGDGHHLDGASCPNCGCAELGLEQVARCRGDCVLVNKAVFTWRRPRRWEMAVFLPPCDPERVFVKRIVGLPGEKVRVRDGDVYIDGELARKSLQRLRDLAIPVFDQSHRPGTSGWRCRWQADPADAGAGRDATLRINAMDGRTHRLHYRNWSLDEGCEQPILDTCAYDGAEQDQNPVHDFLVSADVEVRGGAGWIAVSLTDGADEATAHLPVGGGCCTFRAGSQDRMSSTFQLAPGRTYHLELAFVDRRATLAVDGHGPIDAIDLPAVSSRPPVSRPVQLAARGVDIVVHHFRLSRDVYYTEGGRNGVESSVSLGPGEYFVLGDNSPDSDDSRYWPQPAVPETNLLGRPILVHFPSRVACEEAFGRRWELPVPDWQRMRWLR